MGGALFGLSAGGGLIVLFVGIPLVAIPVVRTLRSSDDSRVREAASKQALVRSAVVGTIGLGLLAAAPLASSPQGLAGALGMFGAASFASLVLSALVWRHMGLETLLAPPLPDTISSADLEHLLPYRSRGSWIFIAIGMVQMLVGWLLGLIVFAVVAAVAPGAPQWLAFLAIVVMAVALVLGYVRMFAHVRVVEADHLRFSVGWLGARRRQVPFAEITGVRTVSRAGLPAASTIIVSTRNMGELRMLHVHDAARLIDVLEAARRLSPGST